MRCLFFNRVPMEDCAARKPGFQARKQIAADAQPSSDVSFLGVLRNLSEQYAMSAKGRVSRASSEYDGA